MNFLVLTYEKERLFHVNNLKSGGVNLDRLLIELLIFSDESCSVEDNIRTKKVVKN